MSGNRTNRRGHGPEPQRYAYCGQSLSPEEWDAVKGWPRGRVRARLNSGRSIESALTMPIRAPKPKREIRHESGVSKFRMSKTAAPGMATDAIRKRLMSYGLPVGNVWCIGGGWYQADIVGGKPRWGRVVDGKVVTQKERPC